MGTLRSTQDWTGRDVNGVTLGEPAIQEDGTFLWDHPTIPSDWIDDNGDIWLEVDDGPQGA